MKRDLPLSRHRKMLVLGAWLSLACAVGACGANQPRATTPSASSDGAPTRSSTLVPAGAELPATSIATTPIRGDALLASFHPVRVTEPCPTSGSTPDGSQESLAVATALEPVLGQVLAYGGAHADEFGGYGLVWDGPRHAAVFAAFASDLKAHRAALNPIVRDPKDLVVCQVAISERVARALMAKLMDELQGRFASIGIGPSGLSIVLMPNEHALADALKHDYGDAITVSFCSAAAPCTYPAA